MMSERKGKRAEAQRRHSIRKAAYVCFREYGFHETTVSMICKKAKVSKGGFYWHYVSKKEVFIDILKTWSREVMGELLEQFETALTVDDYPTLIASALAREVHRGRAIVPLWLEFTVQAQRDSEIREVLAKFFRRARKAIEEILRPILLRHFQEHEVRSVAATILGAYSGLVMQEICDPEGASSTESMAILMQVLYRAISSDLANPSEGGSSSGSGDSGRVPTPSAKQSSSVSLPAPLKEQTDRAVCGRRAPVQEVETLLLGLPSEIQQRAAALRDLILEVVPGAEERVIHGWKLLVYDQGGLFCFIRARAEGLQLGFQRGRSLPDPQEILRGKGKRQRHVEIPLGVPLSRSVLLPLIKAAAAH